MQTYTRVQLNQCQAGDHILSRSLINWEAVLRRDLPRLKIASEIHNIIFEPRSPISASHIARGQSEKKQTVIVSVFVRIVSVACIYILQNVRICYSLHFCVFQLTTASVHQAVTSATTSQKQFVFVSSRSVRKLLKGQMQARKTAC